MDSCILVGRMFHYFPEQLHYDKQLSRFCWLCPFLHIHSRISADAIAYTSYGCSETGNDAL